MDESQRDQPSRSARRGALWGHDRPVEAVDDVAGIDVLPGAPSLHAVGGGTPGPPISGARGGLYATDSLARYLFEQAPVAMSFLDLDGCYERVNDAFCAMVGYPREKLEGQSCAAITHPDDVAADANALRRLITTHGDFDAYEKRYMHASGHLIWARVNITLVHDDTGRPARFIVYGQDVSERRSFEVRLAHAADHDPLTGLLNRRSLDRELRSHTARVLRYGATGAVLMLDLDHFKYFNDSQGHAAGDELIVRISQALRERLRESDVLARLGGDEFAVLLPGGAEPETQAVAESLLEVVRDQVLPDQEQTSALIAAGRRVTVSIGIARFEDRENLAAEEIMVNADLAMYDAKEAGGDRWARYRTDKHQRPKTESHIKWAEEIEYALAHDGFELLAQPIVPLRGTAPRQFELLLRMRDRRGEIVQPASFLYVAERLGLVGEIDGWVTERAIDMLAEQRALGCDLRFEINLSARTIGDERLLELLERRLRATDVPPDRLIFELTETAAVAHVGRATAFAERLSVLGCGFALDNFGAGFGSFYYLKHLAFDYLKIDGEFVNNCTRSETDRTLIAAVVLIARGMRKQTIAEFANDGETLEILTHLGVDYGQGFYLGRPAPLTEHLHQAAPPRTRPT
jgi:diguanylate cyclase (GGDEF)-like protein/PAS domain S-box-containing protein